MTSKISNLGNSPFYKWIILVNVMITTFMVVLDTTVVNVALPSIMGNLGTSINKAEWVLTGYMLSMAAVLAATGWLSNRFGYKKIFIISLAFFTFGSFMCGNSTSIEMLIFWRIVEGVGGGMLMPVGMSIITTVFPPQERSTALGFWSIATAASVSFGPTIGGYLVDSFNWNYIFFINVPIGIFSIFFTSVVQKDVKLESKLKLDVPGFITSIIFLPVFLYGLSQVNSSTNPDGWQSPIVMGCMWISVVCFIAFIIIELNVKSPLIDLTLFKDRNFSCANFVIFIFAVGMFGSTFLIPIYMQDNLGYSALEAGLCFLPVGMIQAFASPISGKIIKYIDARIVIIIGLLFLAYSFHLSSNFSLQTDRFYIMKSLIFRGVGMAILFPPLLAVSLFGISNIKMAQASSISNIVRQVGGSVGVAFLTYLLSQRRTFHAQIFSQSIDYTSETYNKSIDKLTYFYSHIGAKTQMEGSSMAKSYIVEWLDKQAYITGINDDFLAAMIITLIAIIPVLFLVIKKPQNNSIKS